MEGSEKDLNQVTIGIGYLCTKDESYRISLAVLLATVATKPGAKKVEEAEYETWYFQLLQIIIVECLQLDDKILQSVLPLGYLPRQRSDSQRRALVFVHNSAKERLRILSEILVYLLLKTKAYDARIRACLIRLQQDFELPLIDFLKVEVKASEFLTSPNELKELLQSDQASQLAQGLVETEGLDIEEAEKEAKAKKNRIRLAKISAAAVTGGILLGVTGGLAAPAIGAGLTAFGSSLGLGTMATGFGAFLTTTGGTIFATTLFGATGAGLNGYKMSRRIGNKLREFFFHEEKDSKPEALSVLISVSGWNVTKDEVPEIWPENNKIEQSYDCKYILVWEREVLENLANALQKLVYDKAVSLAMSETLKHTTLAALMAAVAWPSILLSLGNIIDNPWNVALNRAKLAGEELAQVLREKKHGERPVSLYGYSIGAVVVCECLKKLCEMQTKTRNFHGLVENVFLVGAAVVFSKNQWMKISQLVAGRFINMYSPNDWLLSFVFRSSGTIGSIAGVSPVNVDDIENIDISQKLQVYQHYEYSHPETHGKIAEYLEIFPCSWSHEKNKVESEREVFAVM